jgi:hypothetical protein
MKEITEENVLAFFGVTEAEDLKKEDKTLLLKIRKSTHTKAKRSGLEILLMTREVAKEILSLPEGTVIDLDWLNSLNLITPGCEARFAMKLCAMGILTKYRESKRVKFLVNHSVKDLKEQEKDFIHRTRQIYRVGEVINTIKLKQSLPSGYQTTNTMCRLFIIGDNNFEMEVDGCNKKFRLKEPQND